MQQLIWSELNEQEKLLALNRPGVSHSDSLTESVKSILLEVKKNKHKAVQQFTSKFDSVKLEDIRVSVQEFKEAEELVPENVVKSFELAIENIKKFHHAQKFSNPRRAIFKKADVARFFKFNLHRWLTSVCEETWCHIEGKVYKVDNETAKWENNDQRTCS